MVMGTVCVMSMGTDEGEVEGREGTLRRVKGYSFQVRPSCKRQEQGSIEWAGAGAGGISAGAGAGASHKGESGQAQVPVLVEYPPVAIGSEWAPAYRSTKVLPQDVQGVSAYGVGGGGSA